MVIAINKVLIIFNGGKINETSIHPLIRSLLIIQSRVTGAPEPDDRQAAAPGHDACLLEAKNETAAGERLATTHLISSA